MRKENDDDLRERFPDPETDERLKVPSPGELPPVPEVTFTRPNPRSGATGGNNAGTGEGQDAGTSFRQEKAPGEFRNMGIASTIGFSLVGSILGGTLLGWLADHYVLHSGATPWGLIVGFFAGVFSGFMNLIRAVNRLNR